MRHSWLLFILVLTRITTNAQSIDSVNTERVVSIQTSFGEIQAKLYNETPLHRDNFIKLVEANFYDSLLFHRVINSFMIQGGDPNSRDAKPNQGLGNGELDYLVPAEFVEGIIHKRGVLAAAREGDNLNPERASSACQFYLVQGRVFTDEELDQAFARTKQRAYQLEVQRLFHFPENDSLKAATAQAYRKNDSTAIAAVSEELNRLVLPTIEKMELTPQQREVYTTIGGTPHLDGAYTVFGEMISGFNVLDSIAGVTTNKVDRPVEDVVFSIQLLK